MGRLDRFEQRLDRMVNGAFAKAFKAEVAPIEIASALQREMDDHAAAVTRTRTVAPNAFEVDLSGHDHDRLNVYAQTLTTELATVVAEYATEQRYSLAGPVQISLDRDDSLETGLFRVRSSSVAGTSTGTAPTSTAAHHPSLMIGVTRHPLTGPVTRVGRGSDVEVRVDDPGVSRTHLEILIGREVLLRDLGSTNGTYVNGTQTHEAVLREGDEIRVGGTAMTFATGSDR